MISYSQGLCLKASTNAHIKGLYSTEKISDVSRKLETRNVPAGYSTGLVSLGKVTSGMDN